MGKVTGAMMTVFLLGSGTTGALETVLGRYAEGVAVALMGAGLLLCGSMLGGRLGAPHGLAREA